MGMSGKSFGFNETFDMVRRCSNTVSFNLDSGWLLESF